jgi:hypothetical protein
MDSIVRYEEYCDDSMNIFDGVIVLSSVVELFIGGLTLTLTRITIYGRITPRFYSLLQARVASPSSGRSGS